MKSKPTKITPRDKLLSYFAWIVGGWNASVGVHPGHLMLSSSYSDDLGIARLLLEEYKKEEIDELKQEIQRLKAEIYDLQKEKHG